MSFPVTKVSLSAPRRRLLELLQRLNFGRIEGLTLRGGDPVLEPSPRVIREYKFGGENGPRPEPAAADFPLKAQQAEMFRTFDRIRDGLIDLLEVKHGLPFKMLFADPA